jgi:ABC-type transporter Mla maintaining outer membrane lipid asymmetry ATPase subunit MlaF
MRRRVSIARALVDRPPIVFYDSPTAGLDPVTCQTIMSLILRGRDLQGATSLLATQRVQDAFGLANFHFDKNSGRILRDKTEADRAAQNSDPANRAQSERKTGQLLESLSSAKAAKSATESPAYDGGISTTNVLVLRDGKIYFEGAADALLNTSDEYLNEFLASAK